MTKLPLRYGKMDMEINNKNRAGGGRRTHRYIDWKWRFFLATNISF